MMRTSHQRVILALCAIVVGMALGTLGGNWLGVAIVIGQSENRLDQYAARILSSGDMSTAESRKVLGKLNASPFPICSDSEITYFRELVYQSQFLKGAGRIRDGKIACSTTLGRGDLSSTTLRPDFTQSDGTLVYRNLAPFRIGDSTVITVQLGDSFIVYSPFTAKALVSPIVHYTVTDLDAATHQMGRLLGETPELDEGILTSPGMARKSGMIYATECAPGTVVCTTTYMSVPEALRANRVELVGFIVLSGLTGALVGFFCFLIHRRKKGLHYQLQKAIRRDALGVVYQPIVDLASGRIVEAEALARWTDEDHLTVNPDVFIKIAEENGFVGSITKLVVRRVLREFGSMMRACPDFRVNVNIAAADLADPEFLPMLEESLEQARVPAESIGIEITESYTARQQVAKDTILRLRKRGHVVHIDDFGTGYSSLAYLHDLAVDAIKIDKAFTRAIGTEAVTISILPQILNMADVLKLRVVVEGIETLEQANYFAAASPTIYAQGWLFGRPVSAEQFRCRLRENELDLSASIPIMSAEEVPAAVLMN
jgi:sensor c-di-GMP phosphodiesterase-like protein